MDLSGDLDPVVGMEYGPSGCGKTTDLLLSFPRALWVAAPGALKPAWGVAGYVVPPEHRQDLVDLEEVTALLVDFAVQRTKAPKGAESKFDAVVIDDLSLIADATVARLERELVDSKNKYAVWDAMRDMLIALRHAARRARIHVFMTAHDTKPHTTAKGVFIRGGPRLPGRMPEDLPTGCDVVFRVVPNDQRRLWPFVYKNSPIEMAQWVQKDRQGLAIDNAPMNAGEMLRFAGFKIRRLAGLEWQEGMVERLATALAANPAAETDILGQAAEFMLVNCTKEVKHIEWTIRDGLDRAHLRLIHSPAARLARIGINLTVQ